MYALARLSLLRAITPTTSSHCFVQFFCVQEKCDGVPLRLLSHGPIACLRSIDCRLFHQSPYHRRPGALSTVIEIGQWHMFVNPFTLYQRKNDNKQFQRAQCGVASHMLPPMSRCMDLECVAAAVPTCVREYDSYVLQSVLVHNAHSVRLFYCVLELFEWILWASRSCVCSQLARLCRDTHLCRLQYCRWHMITIVPTPIYKMLNV